MKKINNIHQLQGQKKQIKQQQATLEDKIKGNWKELKEGLQPVNIARSAFSKIVKDKTEKPSDGESILKTTINYGASLLAQQFVKKAGEKLGKLFKK